MRQKIFKKDYKYKRKFINACIMRIRFGKRNDKTINGYKTYIFKTMKNIVDKNISNYINLLRGISCRYIPEYNEIISDCYIIFDKCLEKYKVTKTNSFYFYYNKALSRNFYKLYQKELNSASVELSNDIVNTTPKLYYDKNTYGMELLYHNLGLTKLEIKICTSKILGEKSADFIRKNKITAKKYTDTLKKIKKELKQLKEQGKYD